jgi:hypothetical protein
MASYSVYGIITLIVFIILIILYYYYYERPRLSKDMSYKEGAMLKNPEDSHDIYITLVPTYKAEKAEKKEKIHLEDYQSIFIYGVIPKNCVYFSITAYCKDKIIDTFSSSMIDYTKDEIELGLIMGRNARLNKEVEYHFIKETRRLKKMERRIKLVTFPLHQSCRDITWKYKIILNDKDEKLPEIKYRIYQNKKLKFRPYKMEKKWLNEMRSEIKRQKDITSLFPVDASTPLYMTQESPDYVKISTNEMKMGKRCLIKIFAMDHAKSQISIFSSIFIHKGKEILSYVTGNYKINSGQKRIIFNEFSFIAEKNEDIYIEENVFYHPDKKIVDTEAIVPFYMSIIPID